MVIEAKAEMTEERGKGLVQMFVKPAVHGGWGYVDSGFRRKDERGRGGRNDGGGANDGGGTGMTEGRGKGLVRVFVKPAVPEGWGYVDSGFRRKDGGEGGTGMTEGAPE